MKKQRKLFYQIVNAIILCSILITVLVSSIILNSSMYNVTQEAKEKFQYFASDYGHQIDIRIASSESTIGEIGHSLKTMINWNQYKQSENYRSQSVQTIRKLLSDSIENREYVYDYFVILNSDSTTAFLSSNANTTNQEFQSVIQNIHFQPDDRGKWLPFDTDHTLFYYIEPLCINDTLCGYIGGRFRKNSFLWGLYDSEQLYWTDSWLIDSKNNVLIMNHNLPGRPLQFSSANLAPTGTQSKGVFELQDANQQQLVIAYSHLSNQWRILVGIEKNRILNRSYDLIIMLIMLIIISSIFSVFIASSISERIVEPIDALLKEIRRISNGELKTPVSKEYMAYENEIGTLAVSIDSMRKSIQKYIHEIEHHAQNLENEVFYQTAELMSANDQLQEVVYKMKVKDRELTATNEELEQTLDNLKETQEELLKSQKLAALSSLVRGISHKLNTPVGTSITTLSYMIQEMRSFFQNMNSVCDEAMAYHEDMYDLIDTANLTMTNLIKTRDILDTLKDITSDSVTENKHYFNLSRMVEELIAALRIRKEYKPHSIHLETDTDIWIESYPSVFTQVFSHLISNSVIHGFSNIQHGEIHIRMHKQGTYVEIDYADNGSGIPSEAIDKIFDPFYTTNMSTTSSGLGLSVIYNQINLKLNGSIVCDAFYKNGTRFKIRVPLA